MTIPADVTNDPQHPGSEPEIDGADWLAPGDDAHQEINDRRARQESAETLRLVRAL